MARGRRSIAKSMVGEALDDAGFSGRRTRSRSSASQSEGPSEEVRQQPVRGRSRKSLLSQSTSAMDELTTATTSPLGKHLKQSPVKDAIVVGSESISSLATPDSVTSDSDCSTPNTSKVPTPAASEVAGKGATSFEVQIPSRLATRRSLHSEKKSLRSSVLSLNSRPSNREIQDSDDDNLSDDSVSARVARRLQRDEYAKPLPTDSTPGRTSRRGTHSQLVVSSPSIADASAKRSRSAVTMLSANGRPTKKSKIAAGTSNIDMDAEIAAAADYASDTEMKGVGLDEDSSLTDSDAAVLDSEAEPYSQRDSLDGEDDDDDDVPLARARPSAKARGKQPAKRRLPTRRSQASRDVKPSSLAKALAIIDSSTDEDDEDFAESESTTALGSVTTSAAASDSETGVERADAAHLRAIAAQRRGYRSNGFTRREQRERDRLEEHHPEVTTMWTTLENMPILKAGKALQPSAISRQLKPFQLEGLAWMKEMEKHEWKGGLLGDEMGLGKTIQAVSLIMSDYPAKQPSLVLVPPVALMQWQSEIKSYTDGTLKTFVFHGTNQKTKGMTVKDLKKFDVIMMSYNSLESMYRKQEKGFTRKDGIHKEKSLIHAIQFHRVILDEAHSIKTRTTMTAKACFALNADYRWCLTGTPLQNRIGEFFSLVRFLNITPFASYLCKQCPCSKLEWTLDANNRCTNCKHAGMQHVSVFNQELLNPIQRFGNFGKGRGAFQKLRLMTDRIMLRRLKKDHTNAMELPVKEIYVDRQFFGEVENDFANSIMTDGQRKFDTYVAQGVLLNNYANIFGLIMQMRQVADHPDLILKKNSEGGQNVLICCICDEPSEDTVRSRCKHDFCRACVASYVRSTEQPDCPRCHIALSIDLEQPEIEQDENLVKKNSIINRIKMDNWTSSSKIELLVHELHRLRSDNASHKSIIFSQFTTMLQLIEWRLRRAGITTVMLDGSMTPAQRQASIEHFMNNVDVECFLVSLKAGGVALNLTEASRVFIVDPWWNPAAEWQSADRCHRIGQTRPCTITRLCIEDSVESRMVLIQEKKTNMINSTVNADDAAMEALTPEDMQFLFRGS